MDRAASGIPGAGLSPDETNNIDIYAASKESVVYINSTVYQRDFFFGVQAVQGLGSGFLINADGQILTNYHVISGSSDVEVTMPPDQSRYRAKVLHRDQGHDLALIQIEPKKKLTSFLKLGDSDNLQVGQKVLAIGNPFGLAGTLTTGIVSSLHRKIQSEERSDLEDMIQTDAAINSGNSGGPLLDSQGFVIGINTAIYGPNGGSVGIGFAMPINRAKGMLAISNPDDGSASSTIGVSTYLVLATKEGCICPEPATGAARWSSWSFPQAQPDCAVALRWSASVTDCCVWAETSSLPSTERKWKRRMRSPAPFR